jgi:ABC-type Fe3+/spermidine/putrescine transport system ATPase subunit
MSDGTRSQARLSIAAVTHRYGEQTALEDVSLDIADGELITLLGPSGCGKTTLLRVIAGFIRPTAGRVVLDGKDVTRVPPHKRPVNMVFQRATLFPHLDVFGNVAFGLRVAKLDKEEVNRRVHEALGLVRLDGFDQRRAYELSGGQMQRIALARALVNRPSVLLLDEPLSALDLKIRLEMEVELRRVHRETGATFVYVTHDQREALALSDRVVVFDEGHIEQVGSPGEIYRSPASPFAARFVGDANVLPVEVVAATGPDAKVLIADAEITVRAGETIVPGPAWLVVRPEIVRLGPMSDDAQSGLRGIVRDLAFRGAGYSYRVSVAGLGEPVKAEVAAGSGPAFNLGSDVGLAWDPSSCSLLPRTD